MRYALAAAALAGVAFASPAPVATATGAASSCEASYNGVFEIEVVNVTTSKRDIEKRADALMLTLNNGILKDAKGRIGYIASNRQFQFDNEAQPGSIYDAGWAVCQNGTLVLGKDAVFQQCLSGTFYNLYDENPAAQCSSVYIQVVNGMGSPAQQIGDGQVTASAVASQISDGQVQATPGPAPITQISDGQIQAPTGHAIMQISDGQIQAATSAMVVSQITDGQVQAPTGKPIQQISDGQIQAPTATSKAVVTQIGDGQIQAPTGGMMKPTNGSMPQRPTSSVQAYTGAASLPTAAVEMMIAAGALAAALL